MTQLTTADGKQVTIETDAGGIWVQAGDDLTFVSATELVTLAQVMTRIA